MAEGVRLAKAEDFGREREACRWRRFWPEIFWKEIEKVVFICLLCQILLNHGKKFVPAVLLPNGQGTVFAVKIVVLFYVVNG